MEHNNLLAAVIVLAEQGHYVVLVERDPDRLAALADGRIPFHEPGLPEAYATQHACGRIVPRKAVPPARHPRRTREEAREPSMAFQFQQVLGLVGNTMQTNFPLDTVKDYAPLMEHFLSGAVSRCVLGPPYSWHADGSTTGGPWTSCLNMDKVADLSVQLFGTGSSYYGQAGMTPTAFES